MEKGMERRKDPIEKDSSLHFRLLPSHLVGSFFFCLPLLFYSISQTDSAVSLFPSPSAL